MPSGAEIAGAAANVLPAVPALIGRGQNNRTAGDFTQNPYFDPFAHRFGPQGADAYAQQRGAQAQGIDQRQAYNANYGQADQSRQGQDAAAQMMLARAQGKVPSVAQMQADRQMQQAQAAQMAGAASARGAAGMALAQQNAANNIANAQGAISNQAQQNASMERLQAEQAASGAFGNMRGQDASQAQFNAQMNQMNRNANDARAMGYEQMGHQALGQEQQGRVQGQATLANSYGTAEALNQRTADQNAQGKGLIDTIGDKISSDVRAKTILSDITGKTPFGLLPGGSQPGVGGGIDMGTEGGITSDMVKAASTGMAGEQAVPGMVGGGGITGGRVDLGGPGGFGGFRADGGPVQAGNPVVVGEKGPELVVPSTWGAGPDIDAQRGAAWSVGVDQQKGQELRDMAAGVESPWQRDLRRYQALRRVSPGLVTKEDRDAARRAQAVLHDAADKPIEDEPEEKPRMTLPGGDKEPPWWAQVGTAAKNLSDAQFGGRREGGGPVDKSKAYVVGEKGPELVVPKRDGYVVPNGAVDWEKVKQSSKLRDPKAFKRDTPAQQRAVKRAVEDRAAADADTLMAQYAQMLGQGPVVHAEEQPTDQRLAMREPPPWLRDYMVSDERAKRAAFDAGQRAGQAQAAQAMGGKADEALAKGYAGIASATPLGGAMGLYNTVGSMHLNQAAEDAANKSEARTPRKAEPGPSRALVIDHPREVPGRADPIADANRSMAGQAYAYKPGMTPPEQKPGEVNVGPMAQNMEQSPVAATAVKTDPATGLKVIDKDKALKVVMSGLAGLQQQQDKLSSMLLNRGGKK